MASGGKRKMIKTPVVARATGKPATQAARKPAPKEAAQAKVPARKPPARRTPDKAQERSDMLHQGLATGASAMAKAIRDAHRPRTPLAKAVKPPQAAVTALPGQPGALTAELVRRGVLPSKAPQPPPRGGKAKRHKAN
jgi:hypothetical protein